MSPPPESSGGGGQASQPGDAILLDSNSLAPSSVFQVSGTVMDGKLRISVNGAESGDIPLPDEAPEEVPIPRRIAVNIPFEFEETGATHRISTSKDSKWLGIYDRTSKYEVFVREGAQTPYPNAFTFSFRESDNACPMVRILPTTMKQICEAIEDNILSKIGGNFPAIVGFNLAFSEGGSTTLMLMCSDVSSDRKLAVVSPDGSLYTIANAGLGQSLNISYINIITLRTY